MENKVMIYFSSNRLGSGSQDKLQEGKKGRIEKGCIKHDFLPIFCHYCTCPSSSGPIPGSLGNITSNNSILFNISSRRYSVTLGSSSPRENDAMTH